MNLTTRLFNLTWLAAAISVSFMISCAPLRQGGSANVKDAEETAEEKAEILKNVVARNNDFALAFYQNIKAPNKNMLVSPFSISSVLAMTYAGAEKETASEMVQALRFDTDKIKTHRGFKLLNDKLAIKKPDDKFQLTQANRLFGRQDLNFKDDFLAITKDYYASQLETMDFRAKSESSRKKINAWVEEQTRQRIVDLLPAGVITPETTLVLANALYFKAPWAKSFSEKSTLKDQDFVTEAGTKSASKVSLMKQTDSFMYASNKEMGVTAVELGFSIPYGSDIQATMTFILPNDDKKFAAAEKNLTITNLDTIFKSLAPRKVELSIPKFKVFDSFDNLKDTLSKMGMPTAFEERKANFLGMADISPENIYLGKVIHKTFLETTEAGVEASAATAAIMFGTASARIDNEEPVVFKADHAFMYVLRDRNTGTILFIGKYADVAK